MVGNSCLPSVGAPDSPVYHRIVNSARSPSLFGEADRCSHGTLGTPDSPVWPVTVGASHTSPVDCALISPSTVVAGAAGSSDIPVHTEQFGEF